jgi:predicted heme/steroid binding protein/uncharacterized membrane protein
MDKKVLTRKELQQFDGKDGRPIYIVHKGKIIDVTGSPLWKGGVHMMRHQAGQDLTVDIGAAPHGLEVLERYPQVATLSDEQGIERQMPSFLSNLLARFPILARHPHPMMVHFPTVFFLAAGFFSILYLLTKHQPFETTAFHSLCGGLLFTPIAMATGFFTWWLNYAAKRMRPTTIKITLASILLPLATAAVVWRFLTPDVLHQTTGFGLLYLLFVLALSPMVLVISYYGGTLTFPIKKVE